MADWAPEVGLYAYGAQNTVVMLNSRAQTVRTMLSGHGGRWERWGLGGCSPCGSCAHECRLGSPTDACMMPSRG